jgi:hypothetical protein
MQKRAFLSLALASIFIATSAVAQVTSASNAIIETNPANFQYKKDGYQDTGAAKLHVWDEQINYRLGSNLIVDKAVSGNYNGSNASSNAVISAGKAVNSHYLYFDPKNSQSIVSTITFATNIIGILYIDGTSSNPGNLWASDFLIPGGVGSLPGSFFGNRPLESGDKINWLANNKTITIDWGASSPGDQVRVITDAVPEPTTMIGLALGAAALIRRRRKNA